MLDIHRFPLLEALHAEGPAPDRATQMMLYGQFVGSWNGRLVYHPPDSPAREAPCEVHFGCDLWQITWIDPVRQDYDRMTGRKVGNDIVQEYRMDDGARCQWMFTEITPSSFHWIRRESKDDGETWTLRAEFFLHRAR